MWLSHATEGTSRSEFSPDLKPAENHWFKCIIAGRVALQREYVHWKQLKPCWDIHVIKQCWTGRRRVSPHDSSRQTTSHWRPRTGRHSCGTGLRPAEGTGCWTCPSFCMKCWSRSGPPRCPPSPCRWPPARSAHPGRCSGGCSLWAGRSHPWRWVYRGRHPGRYSPHWLRDNVFSQCRPRNTCHWSLCLSDRLGRKIKGSR